MRYQPTDRPDRGFIGKNWTRFQLRSLQIVLQATHGVVSGEPVFFKRAFGDQFNDFEEILARPHHFIFNREWYESLGGREEFEEYQHATKGLTFEERHALLERLSSCDPSRYRDLCADETDARLKTALRFFVPITKEQEREIWSAQKAFAKEASAAADFCDMPEEDRVEDAGLDEDIGVGSEIAA
jgi:hypothetical protein